MRPAVSICIPVLNGAAYLAAAVESTLTQDEVDLEIVVADNGSTDGSFEVLRPYLRDTRVRYVRHDAPLGMGADWNRAVRYAEFPIVKVLPCDDVLLPKTLFREASALLEAPDLVFAASPRRLMTRKGTKLLTMRPLRPGLYRQSNLIRLMGRSARNLIGEPGAVTFRRDSFERAGGFDNKLIYYCDADLWIRLAAFGPGKILADPGTGFRAHGTSLTAKNFSNLFADCLRFRAKLGETSTPGSLFRLRLTILVRQMVVSLLNSL